MFWQKYYYAKGSKTCIKSKAFQIGLDLDLMQAWIFSKLDTNDQVTSLLVCKSWGKAIMEPDMP